MLSILLLGFLIGAQHAMEADHVAAVASLASGQSDKRAIVGHGVAWGLGHALTLIAVTLVVSLSNTMVNEVLAAWLEFLVGVMLVGLGVHVFWRLRRSRIHFHFHHHGDAAPHFHAHSHLNESVPHAMSSHRHVHPARLPGRSLAVGVMHGMAGSAALVVLAAASYSSPWTALAFVLVFGAGSIAGMAALSFVIAIPLTWAAATLSRVHAALQMLIGAATMAIGGAVMYETQLQFLLRGP